MAVVALKTLKTSALDNHGASYVAHLVMNDETPGRPMGPCYRWVLSIEGAPGGWYLSTLLGVDGYGPWKGGDELPPLKKETYLDAGQEWKLVNLGELLKEAIRLI